MELNDAVFGVEVNEHLVHLAVVAQLANKRQGTQKAKTRSEVSGGGRENRGDRKEPAMKTGFHKSTAVDRRRRSIRTDTERLLHRLNKKEKRAALSSL